MNTKIKKVYGLALTFCFTATVLITPGNSKTKESVIVVGGGMSGLAAASQLKENGFKVTVLESQDRVGGRIRTNRTTTAHFEEGANWIHGPKKNPITKLAKEAKATTKVDDEEDLEIYDTNGKTYSDKEIEKAEEAYEKALEKVARKGSVKESFQEVFDRLYPGNSEKKLWKYMLSAYLEFDMSADIKDLTSIYFDHDEAFEGDDVLITNGYDRLTEYLAKNLDVKLKERVTEIDYTKNPIKVTSDKKVYESDYVVVTVPLGVLQKNVIRFVPELTKKKKEALKNLKMGTVNKFLLTWDKPFWDTKVQYIGYTSEEKGKFNHFINLKKVNKSNALLTFSFGEYAIKTEKMSDEDITDQIMDNLKVIYGKNIPQPINMVRTRWNSNVNSFGSYSYVPVGSTPKAYDTLAEDIDEKVFFAGEHTERRYPATVHGAYLSGKREAKKIYKISQE